MTTARMEALQYVLYIRYLVLFKQELVQAFINSGNKVNAMTPAYIKKLDFRVQKTDIST